MQPTMQFVRPKSPELQDIQALHQARQRILNHRTATVCQIRGLLLDRDPHWQWKQYSGNQKPVSVSPELKALALKRPRPLLLLLAKELNLRMAATLLHGWVWFHASIQWRQADADEYDEKRRQASADTFYSWCPRCRQGCHE